MKLWTNLTKHIEAQKCKIWKPQGNLAKDFRLEETHASNGLRLLSPSASFPQNTSQTTNFRLQFTGEFNCFNTEAVVYHCDPEAQESPNSKLYTKSFN